MARIQMPDGTVVELTDGSALNFLGGLKGGGGITPWSTIQTGPAPFKNPVANAGLQMLAPLLAQTFGFPEAVFKASLGGDMKSPFIAAMSERYVTPQWLRLSQENAMRQGETYGHAIGGAFANASWMSREDRAAFQARWGEAGRSPGGQFLSQIGGMIPFVSTAMGGNFDAAQQTLWAGAQRASIMQGGLGYLPWGKDPARTSAMLAEISKSAMEDIEGLAYGFEDADGGYSMTKGRQLFQANRVSGFEVEALAQMQAKLWTSTVGTKDGVRVFAEMDRPDRQRALKDYASQLRTISDMVGSEDVAKLEQARQHFTGGKADRMDDRKIQEIFRGLTSAAITIGEDGATFMDAVLKMQQDLGSSIGMSMTGRADAFRDSQGRLSMGFGEMGVTTKMQGFAIARARQDLSPGGIEAAEREVAAAKSVMLGSSLGKATAYMRAMEATGEITTDQMNEFLASRSTGEAVATLNRIASVQGIANFNAQVKTMSNAESAAVIMQYVDPDQAASDVQALAGREMPQRQREIAAQKMRRYADRTAAITGVSTRGDAGIDAAEFEGIRDYLKKNNVDATSLEVAYRHGGLPAALRALRTVSPELADEAATAGTASRSAAYHKKVSGMSPERLSLMAQIQAMRSMSDAGIDKGGLNRAAAFLAGGEADKAQVAFDAAMANADPSNKALAARRGDEAVAAVRTNARKAVSAQKEMAGGPQGLTSEATQAARLPGGSRLSQTVKNMNAQDPQVKAMVAATDAAITVIAGASDTADRRDTAQKLLGWLNGNGTTLADVIGLDLKGTSKADLKLIDELSGPKKLRDAPDSYFDKFDNKKVAEELRRTQKGLKLITNWELWGTADAEAAAAAAVDGKSASEKGVKGRDPSVKDSAGAGSRDTKAAPSSATINGVVTIRGLGKKDHTGDLSGSVELA